ncbi:uncharacterized protein LOC129594826 [Paramacrobiotus metropolitanus]|uniref:uncharacterized protein LOC129594826 n=1 Tax=Paramacrobiotus metropolitanus TaxID=2943436 RepID=UPI0024458C25|nr:uncharacterized protein LOC129594826 [Paramacrobiotus metropolitanus]
MDVFHQLHGESLRTLQDVMTEQRELLVHNAEIAKSSIKKAFGEYIEWLREREAVLTRAVDRAVESNLSRWQLSVCETLVSLRTLKESVELLDDPEGCDAGTSRDVKDQIERLLRDMSLAMQSDLKTEHVVKFEESGRAALQAAVDNCGEVFEASQAAAAPAKTSKWSNWLHSSVNLEHLEEPELPYDFDDLGAIMSTSKMLQSSPTVEKKPLMTAMVIATTAPKEGKNSLVDAMTGHFATIMSTSMDQWLKTPPSPLPATPLLQTQLSTGSANKKRQVCPGETGNCTHAENSLEIENLDQLRCISPVSKDLQTWLMQPDVVQLPPVVEVCRADRPCQSLTECHGTNHCLNFFYSLSRRTEDWLSPTASPNSFSLVDSDCASVVTSVSDGKSEDYELINTAARMMERRGETFIQSARTGARPRVASVSEELVGWLKDGGGVTQGGWCESRDCCMNSGKNIEEWLLKAN